MYLILAEVPGVTRRILETIKKNVIARYPQGTPRVSSKEFSQFGPAA